MRILAKSRQRSVEMHCPTPASSTEYERLWEVADGMGQAGWHDGRRRVDDDQVQLLKSVNCFGRNLFIFKWFGLPTSLPGTRTRPFHHAIRYTIERDVHDQGWMGGSVAGGMM